MPLPLIIIGGAAIAGATGIANGANGAKKMIRSGNAKKEIGSQHDANIEQYQTALSETTLNMDALGEYEFTIMSEFQDFADLIEKIENRPEFGEIIPDNFELPDFTLQDIKQVAVGAIAIASGIGGAATGTFGGFAAAGGAYAAVMALGTASTGTAIASLSGAAATNAALAALGGGTLAMGGLGVAGGTAVLSAATLGVGLMVGGIIFNITGNTVENRVGEAKEAVDKETEEVEKICVYLDELDNAAINYHNALAAVKRIYDKHFSRLEYTVVVEGKTDYRQFTDTDKLAYQNTALLVGILYDMLKIKVVRKADEDYNEVNVSELDTAVQGARRFLEKDPLVKTEQLEILSESVAHKVEEVVVTDEQEMLEVVPEAPESDEKNDFSEKFNKGLADMKSRFESSVNELQEKVSPGMEAASAKVTEGLGTAVGKMGSSLNDLATRLKSRSKKDSTK